MGKNVMHGGKMHIACPNCRAIYDVPESKLDSVLSLRCSSCHYSWDPRPPKPSSGQGASANRQQSTAGAGRKPQPGTGFRRASASASQPQQDSSSSTSSVTVSSVTVSSVTVSSNQPTAPTMDASPTPQMDSTPVEKAAPFGRPAPEAKPETAPEPGTDYVVHLTRPRQDHQSQALSKQPIPPERSLFSLFVGCALLVLILLTSAILARHGLMKLVPASTGFFKALGIS